MEEKIYCSNCGELIDTDDYGELDGEILCSDCHSSLDLMRDSMNKIAGLF